MDEPKKIITCGRCGNQFRIPLNKHIRFSCPTCNSGYEYKNGELMHGKSKRRIPFAYFLLISVVIIGLALWIFRSRPNTEIELPDPNPVAYTPDPLDTINSIVDTLPPTTIDYLPRDEASIRDSIFQEKLKDFGEDLLQDILEELVDILTKELEKGDWQKADEMFEQVSEVLNNSGTKGKTLLQKNEARLALVKSKIIRQNPNKGDLHESNLVSETGVEQTQAKTEIRNGTVYTLTLYYTGPVSKILTISPNGTAQTSLPKGVYSIVAKVSNPLIPAYFGTETYRGFRYSSQYHIKPRRY